MATNTAVLKTFAQQTRAKLVSLVSTKMRYVLNEDTAELRGYERQIAELRNQIQSKTEKIVIEEIAYTWFNRVMALRFMDANGYNAPMIVTPAAGQTRPEILQDAMGGSIDDELMLSAEERLLPEAMLYRKLLVAVCNKKMPQPMPFLFEHISDYTELLLPDDLLSDQSFVADIRNGMTDEDCQNVEIIGWLYQFYITDRKADAESKKSKKEGLKSDEQAAATQLFTPHWIVRYMVENSLGRIWMTLHPESSLIKVMPYYIATPDGQTDIIPEDIHSARDIRFLDPCVGSGHILVYAFDLFCEMYEEEGEQAKDIPALILENNLYGIDIDRRCYQLASFALTMKARAYYRRYLRRTVTPHVISLEPIDHDTIQSTGTWPTKSLMWQFENIDTIGSLLKITKEEYATIFVEECSLFGVRQKLLKAQAEYLSRKYHCVVTNPPYLGKGFCDALKEYVDSEFTNSKADTMTIFMERCMEMCCSSGKVAMINLPSWLFLGTFEQLRRLFINRYHIDSLLHMGRGIFGIDWGSTAFVISKRKSQNFGSYFRLHKRNFQHIYHDHIGQLFLQVKNNHNLRYDFDKYRDDDVSKIKNLTFDHSDNGTILYFEFFQDNFLRIPNALMGYWLSEDSIGLFEGTKVNDVAYPKVGFQTGNNNRFLRFIWEPSYDRLGNKWIPCTKGGPFRRWSGNIEYCVNWENNAKEMHQCKGAIFRNEKFYFIANGTTWSTISAGKPSFRFFDKKYLFETKGSVCFMKEYDLYTLMGYLNSCVAYYYLSALSPTLDYHEGPVGRLPFVYPTNNNYISITVQQNITISKQDWDAHETSLDFKRNPLWEQQLDIVLYDMQEHGVLPEDATIESIGEFNLPGLLQTLEALVGSYKSEWEDHFHTLHHNEEELNRKFIEIYGLQDELTPEVPLDEVTILQKGEISIEESKIVWHEDVIIKQFISYLIGCFMGRYAIDKPGLIIASQGQKIEDLDLPIQTIEIDDDGIIPIIQEEDFFVDDMTQRIEAAVKTLFGEMNFYENIKYIKSRLGQNLRDYLYKNYYADHQQMYSVKGAKRPIYWLFSSQMGDKKKKGYFKALVYMHRLEADTLSKLHADYVHPYIQKIEQQLREAEDNATRDDLNQTQHNKALKLAEELRDKVREVKAFETVLVEMASARITIDLDDGVKANYPKFYPLVEPIKGLEKSNED